MFIIAKYTQEFIFSSLCLYVLYICIYIHKVRMYVIINLYTKSQHLYFVYLLAILPLASYIYTSYKSNVLRFSCIYVGNSLISSIKISLSPPVPNTFIAVTKTLTSLSTAGKSIVALVATTLLTVPFVKFSPK